MQTRPTLVSLVCSSCSSDRDFASDFLQIPLHNGHHCHWLVVPTTKPTTDFHRQVVAHAGHTQIKKKLLLEFLFLFRNSTYAKFIPQLETCHLKLISHYPYSFLSLLLSKYCSYPFIRLMFAYKFKAIAFNIILNFIKAPFYKSRN